MIRRAGKTVWIAVLIILITGTISCALGIYDYKKSVLDAAEADFFCRNYCVINAMEHDAKDKDDDYLEACVGIAFKEEDDIRAAWLYNTETGRVSCAEGNRYGEDHPQYFYDTKPDGKILNDIRLDHTVKYKIRDGAQYSYRALGKFRLIMFHDVQEYVQEIKETVRSTMLLYLATGALVSLLIIAIQFVRKGDALHIGAMAVLFVWITGISINMFLGTYQMFSEKKKEFNNIVLEYIDEDITDFTQLTEDEAVEHCMMHFPERYSDGQDPYLVMAEYYAGTYVDGEYITSIKPKDNILDLEVPVSGRVEITWAGNENELTECIIRAITIGILALVMYYEWINNREKGIYGEGTDDVIRSYQGIVTFSGLVSGLVKSIMVVVLAEIAKGKGFSVATAITLATVAIFLGEPLRDFLSTAVTRRVKSFRFLLLTNSAAILIGLLLCGISKSLVIYLIGFVLIKVCAGSSCSYKDIYKEIKNRSKKASDEASSIASSYYGGNLVGMIITGIIAGLVSNRTLFLIAAAVSSVNLLLCSTCRIEVENPDLSRLNVKQLFSNREIRIFFILIPLMAGALDYYYDYVVPISVDNLRYSVGTISFLYLIRLLVRYCIYNVKNRTGIGKKLPVRTQTVLYFLIKAAALILLLLNRPTIVSIAVMMVLFGAVDAFLKDGIKSEGKSKIDKSDSKGEFSSLVDTGTSSGNFITSLAVNLGLPVSVIPGLLIASPLLYWLLMKKDSRKT